MDKKEIKLWVNEAIQKEMDWEDVLQLAKAQEMSKEDTEKVYKLFLEEKEEKEKMELSFFQRRKLKKTLKKAKGEMIKATNTVLELNKNLKQLDKEEKKELELNKERMILAILGKPEEAIEGLNVIFDITDDDGKEITKEDLEKRDIMNIAELLEELIEKLEKEI